MTDDDSKMNKILDGLFPLMPNDKMESLTSDMLERADVVKTTLAGLKAGTVDKDVAQAMVDKVKKERLYEWTQRRNEIDHDLVIMHNYWELLSIGFHIEITDSSKRRSASLRLAEVAREIKSQVTPAERLRLMVKHGRRALQILAVEPHSTEPDFEGRNYDNFCETMLHSPEYALSDNQQLATSAFEHREALHKCALRRLYSSALWAKSGCNQFSLSPDLAAALALTEVPEMDAEELQLPYPTMAVSLPPGVIPFFAPENDGSTKYEWADTLWIERSGDTVQWSVRWKWLETTRTSALDFSWLDDRPVEALEEEFAPEDVISLDAAVKLIRNFLLWLNSKGGLKAHKSEIVPKKLAEKRAKNGDHWPRQWVFGKEVKLSPELRRAAAEQALGRSRQHAQAGWKVRARFTVRGHWRNQSHGPGRALRRRQWIAPFWKGPKGEEAWAHIYKAEDSK